MYSLPAFLTPYPLIHFIAEEITGSTNEEAKCRNKAQ